MTLNDLEGHSVVQGLQMEFVEYYFLILCTIAQFFN